MIRSVVGWSLRFRLLVVVIAVGVMAVGISQLRDAPVDVLPEFTPPYVEVQTEALGLSADEVEQLITVPLEADLLNGVQGVDVIRSQSVAGLSSVVMVFEPETDLYQARQMVQERLIQAHALPNVSKPPHMIQPLSSSSRVMMIGLDPKELSPTEASVLSRWVISPNLMGVPGVANVAVWGMRNQQLQVQVDPERLRDQGVTLNQVVSTTGNAQLVSPLSFLEASTPGTGGFIETPNQRLQVRHLFDEVATPEGLGKVPVEGTDGRLRLADVASVKEGHQPLIGDAVVNGGEGLQLVVEKFPGANTLEVTRGVEEALDDLKPGLAGMEVDSEVFRPATFVEDATSNLALALAIGGALLVLVLLLLSGWRTALVGLFTIPLSLVAAAFVLHLLGETFNALVFAGLAVAIAVLIDDAVGAAHNVARRLREDRRDGGDGSIGDVVLEAVAEARRPITYAALIALLPIVPIVFMEGRPGAFFEPLALSYALAVLASMVVALTITPALGLLLFSRGAQERREAPITRLLGARYDGALSRAVRRPRAALIAAGVCLVAFFAALPLFDTSLIPTFKDRDVLVRLDGPPGTSEPRMTETATQLGRELREIPGVENVGAHIGRAVTGDRIVDVSSSELWVRIGSGADHDATMASIEAAVGRLDENIGRDVSTYSKQELRDVGALVGGEEPNAGASGLDVLTGADNPIVARVYGQDPEILKREAEKLQRVVAGVDGVVDARVEMEPEKPVLEIETDLAKAQSQGIKPGEVRRAEAALLQGIEVGSIFREQKVFEVIVQGVPATRESVEDVRELLIDKPGGGHVRLGEVANVSIRQAPVSIERDAVSRYVDVTAGVSGRDAGAVADEIRDRLTDVRFPLEYHAEVITESSSQEANVARIAGFAVAAAIAIFLLLQAAFGSWRLAAVAFLTLPAALLGGAVVALIDGATISLGALLGFFALLALAARNVVVLFQRFQLLQIEEAREFGAELVERGARGRFAPTLVAALAAAVALLPFAIAGEVAGLEILNPMALVVLGGLVSTTLLGLFVLPALYLRFGDRARPEIGPRIDPPHRRDEVEGEPVAETPEPSIVATRTNGSNGHDGETGGQPPATLGHPETREGGSGASAERRGE